MSAIAFFILVLMVMDMSYCKSLHELADLKAVSSGASHYPDSSSNRTWVLESGKELTKPYVMSENTLSGKSDVIGIDRILFPASYSNLPQPLRNIINTIIRIPVIVAGLIVGENAELIGLQAMQVGNALLMMGSHNFGQFAQSLPLYLSLLQDTRCATMRSGSLHLERRSKSGSCTTTFRR